MIFASDYCVPFYFSLIFGVRFSHNVRHIINQDKLNEVRSRTVPQRGSQEVLVEALEEEDRLYVAVGPDHHKQCA